jgi:hypothetical protein
VSDPTAAPLRVAFARALRDAYAAGLGVPPGLEPVVRSYARSLRLDGIAVEKMLIDVKSIVREETGQHEVVYIPRVVGWAVSGYFAGTSPKDKAKPA